MDLPLYQQLQLSPPSLKPDPEDHHHQSSFFYYHSSPAFAGADAAFHHSCYLDPGAATLPSAEIDCSPPPELSLMDQALPAAGNTAQGTEHHGSGSGSGVGALESRAAAAARKDRHSKICTAGGMRDRRMRLSLDVARKFFALQDMLGFDKASKTVQWLLNTSKSAIREVMATDDMDPAHSSECEDDDGSSISLSNMPAPEKKGDRGEGKKPATARAARRAANLPKPSRKSGGANAHTIPDKESRTKARERARERTKEKNRMRWVTLASTINLESAARDDELIMASPNNNLNRSSSSSMNTAASADKLEERCCTNGGRTVQEASIASHAIMAGAFGNGGTYGSGSSSGSNYYYQHQQLEEQQWELGGVVFANSRLY